VRLYELLQQIQPSPIVALNHAVALAMVEGPARGLALVDEAARRGGLDGYHLLYAARADLLRRMGSLDKASSNYRRAIAMAGNGSERRFLERRLRDLKKATTGPSDRSSRG
jgi:RNA polymerase sigma-70 factor (ECF subfamily)